MPRAIRIIQVQPWNQLNSDSPSLCLCVSQIAAPRITRINDKIQHLKRPLEAIEYWAKEWGQRKSFRTTDNTNQHERIETTEQRTKSAASRRVMTARRLSTPPHSNDPSPFIVRTVACLPDKNQEPVPPFCCLHSVASHPRTGRKRGGS